MSHPEKQKLLAEFAGYLEQTDFTETTPEHAPDLATLLSEMAGLKMEVKAQSRHLKTMLDQFSVSLDILQNDNQTLTEELQRQQQLLTEQKRDTQQNVQRKMVLDFLEVYDRLAAGAAALKKYKPVASMFKHSQKQDRKFIKRLREGQEMSINRMEQLLLSYQVNAIATQGKTLDPQTMTAVATTYIKKSPQGQVVEEIRKGFYFQDSILRLAEVKVNKKPDEAASSIQ